MNEAGGLTARLPQEAEAEQACALHLAQRTDARLGELLTAVRGMQAAILAQQGEIAKLNRALDSVRVSRTQELAVNEAIRARARALRRDEGLPEQAEKKIAGAIRTTLREVTGARAAGDIKAGQFDRCMDLIGSWRMAGALRRIGRETAQERAHGKRDTDDRQGAEL